MELYFKQDSLDKDMWQEYLVVPFKMSCNKLWHKGTVQEDVLNEMLIQLGIKERTYQLTDSDTINCDSFSLTFSNGKVSINY